jgi:hypothetical protein
MGTVTNNLDNIFGMLLGLPLWTAATAWFLGAFIFLIHSNGLTLETRIIGIPRAV